MRILTTVFLLAATISAQDKHHHSKTQKAHDHGAAQLDIAIDAKTAEIEFHAPAMGLVGFEYTPTKAADKKKQADALASFKVNLPKILTFDAAAGCKITAKNVEVHQEEPDHAEIDGDFAASCAQPLAGKNLAIDFSKFYPAYTTIKVQVVGASGSTGAELKNGKGVVVLPK